LRIWRSSSTPHPNPSPKEEGLIDLTHADPKPFLA
jgi:hypothetical protein